MAGIYTPTDPICFGERAFAPLDSPRSRRAGSVVVGGNAELMETVADLWIGTGWTVVDATYGEGAFWAWPDMGRHFELIEHDKYKGDGVDFRALPEADGAVDGWVFDPPYRPKHGSKPVAPLANAYGVGHGESPNTMDDVLALYRAGLGEGHRVLKRGGIAFVKCQDMSYANRLHVSTLDVMAAIVAAGFEIADQFILVSDKLATGPRAMLGEDGRTTQQRAYRSHSVLWVAQKPLRPARVLQAA